MRTDGNTRRVPTGTLRVPYSRTERITELRDRDVQLIRKVAKHCFTIDRDGTPIHYEENTSGTLDIIAVIGPGEHRGESFDTMLLLEVGYGRSRPYRKALGDTRTPIHGRRSYATLSQHQLTTFWPTLEHLMFKMAQEKVSGWQSPHAEITTRYHVATKGYGLAQRNQRDRRIYLRGPRFSVSQKDPLVLASFLQSELATDRRQTPLMSDLEGARKLLTARLCGYAERTLLSKKHIARLDRQSKSGVAMFVEFLRQRKFPPHHLYLILRDMTPVIRRGAESILDYAKISSEEEIEYWGSLLAHHVPILSRGFIYTIPLRRNGDDIRKVYDLKKRAWVERGPKKQDFVVFEIVPPL